MSSDNPKSDSTYERIKYDIEINPKEEYEILISTRKEFDIKL